MRRIDRRRSIPDYVDTLDGFRAIAACLVMMFHFWQQSWVTMELRLGPVTIDFSAVVCIGSLGVELLFILSGFCLYYPLAMHPERRLHVGSYIYKRCVRILPTYLLCVLVCSAYQIGRLDAGLLWRQFIGNLTLTQMSTAELSYNHLNPVLWSIAIEAQFYVLFPLLIKPFRKRPYWVMLAAFVVGESWRWYLREIDHSQINWLMNQLPGMIDAFVGGMLAAHMTAALKRSLTGEQQNRLAPMFTAAFVLCFMLYFLTTQYIHLRRYDNLPDNLSRLQMYTRKFVVAAFVGCIVSSIFAVKPLRRLLGNPATRFVSSISYQLYLWHMWLCLRLKDWRIPAYSTERPMDDAAWRFPYLMLSIGLSVAVAILAAYLIERPISAFAMNRAPRWARESLKSSPPSGAPDNEDDNV